MTWQKSPLLQRIYSQAENNFVYSFMYSSKITSFHVVSQKMKDAEKPHKIRLSGTFQRQSKRRDSNTRPLRPELT